MAINVTIKLTNIIISKRKGELIVTNDRDN